RDRFDFRRSAQHGQDSPQARQGCLTPPHGARQRAPRGLRREDMIEVEGHPEELLDRIASDTASADDLRQFEEHAVRCPACAAHRTLRPMVRSALLPALEDKMRNERAVSLAMSGLGGPAQRRRPGSVWLLAAAAVLVTGIAGAGYWARHRTPPHPIADAAAA